MLFPWRYVHEQHHSSTRSRPPCSPSCRREVAEHPAPAPAPAVGAARRRRRLRLAAVGRRPASPPPSSPSSACGGSGGVAGVRRRRRTAPATSIVTVHRLDDAAGLENALTAKGIDADVSYDADGVGDVARRSARTATPLPERRVPAAHGQRRRGRRRGAAARCRPTSGAGARSEPARLGARATATTRAASVGDPATLTQQGSDWVLRIPADSPLQDRHVDIGTDSDGALSVAYAGDEPNSMCGMVSLTRGTRRADPRPSSRAPRTA